MIVWFSSGVPMKYFKIQVKQKIFEPNRSEELLVQRDVLKCVLLLAVLF